MIAGSITSGPFVAPITIMFLRLRLSQGKELCAYSFLNFHVTSAFFWGNGIDIDYKVIISNFISTSLNILWIDFSNFP